MQRFTRLYTELDSTTSTNEKTAALVRYFAEAPAEDAAWAVALLLGQRPKGSASSAALRALTLETTGYPDWLLSECRAAVGDLSETMALLLPDPESASGVDTPLSEVLDRHVLPLSGASDDDRRTILADALAQFGRDERLVYLKLVRGGFRVGVQRRLVARALAEVAGVDPGVMEHRLAGEYTPTSEAYHGLLAAESSEDHTSRPYPLFLARQLNATKPSSVEAALGDPAEWLAEWKWDGIRAQLVRRSGEAFVWSRGEELITHQFPEIAGAASDLPDGVVLDGELLMWREDAPLPFSNLQTRLNRKHAPPPQLGLFDRDRVVLMVYDILEHDHRDLRSLAQSERAVKLSEVLGSLPEANDTIVRSDRIAFETWDELAALRETSRERGVEGVMLKHRDSTYAAGRVAPERGGGWWKWKIDPYTADAVLVYAYPGSGRRASLYTDYAFAVWDDTSDEVELVPFARAYSGLTNEEIEELDRWIRANTVRRMGPAREVKPTRVFEIAFEGIARSDRHRAGVATRFPRILRERVDKAPPDADTLTTIMGLLPEP